MLYGWKREFDAYKLSSACADLTITVFEIQRDICEKNRNFIIPLAFDARVKGVSVRISAPPLGWKNENGVATRQ